MFEGLPERFIKELKRVLPNDTKSRVLAPAKRDTMCWEGGSILASLPSFKNMWITRAEYNEQKDQIVSKKTFWSWIFLLFIYEEDVKCYLYLDKNKDNKIDITDILQYDRFNDFILI